MVPFFLPCVDIHTPTPIFEKHVYELDRTAYVDKDRARQSG